MAQPLHDTLIIHENLSSLSLSLFLEIWKAERKIPIQFPIPATFPLLNDSHFLAVSKELRRSQLQNFPWNGDGEIGFWIVQRSLVKGTESVRLYSSLLNILLISDQLPSTRLLGRFLSNETKKKKFEEIFFLVYRLHNAPTKCERHHVYDLRLNKFYSSRWKLFISVAGSLFSVDPTKISSLSKSKHSPCPRSLKLNELDDGRETRGFRII